LDEALGGDQNRQGSKLKATHKQFLSLDLRSLKEYIITQINECIIYETIQPYIVVLYNVKTLMGLAFRLTGITENSCKNAYMRQSPCTVL